MRTTIKFFKNPHENARSKLISRTLLKLAKVNRDWPGTHPQHQELWHVRIVDEMHHGKSKGFFIVDPINRVQDTSLIHLPPTMFNDELHNGVLVITPKITQEDTYWILAKDHKKMLARKHNTYAVVVNQGGNLWF